jgi:uncharacterized protein (TIGR02285 family)
VKRVGKKILKVQQSIVLTLLLVISAGTTAKELKWYISDFFPCHILFGVHKGTGFCDSILAHIMQTMPQYQHSIEHVVLTKLVSSTEAGKQFCTLQLLKTEKRQQRFNFTDYYLTIGNNGIFVRHNDTRFTPFLVDENTISLTRLLKNPDLVLARDISRTYGNVIDELLLAAEPGLTQVHLTSDARYAELLDNKRIDYTIAYPTELHNLNTGRAPLSLKFLKIAEPQPPGYAHISCSKSVDIQTLNDINEVVLAYRDDVFKVLYQNWLPPVNH